MPSSRTATPRRSARSSRTRRSFEAPLSVQNSEKTANLLLHDIASLSPDVAPQRPQPRGQAELVCTFEIDVNGLLKVSALDKSSGRRANITITNSVERLSSSEIDQMISDAQRFANVDKEFTARHEAKQELESYIASGEVESTSAYSLYLVSMVPVREESKRDVASEFARGRLLSGRLSATLTDFPFAPLAMQPLHSLRQNLASPGPRYVRRPAPLMRFARHLTILQCCGDALAHRLVRAGPSV